MALMGVVSCFAYLHPAEARALLVRHLVAPSPAFPHQPWFALLLHDADVGVPGKTGMLDDSLSLDCLCCLNELFWTIVQHKSGDETLFNFSTAAFNKKFGQICRDLRLDPLKPSLYALRHGGASEDLNSKARLTSEVQLRGRWRTLASLRRYGKAVRLATQLAKIPAEIAKYVLLVESKLLDLFKASASLGGHVPAPPRPVARG